MGIWAEALATLPYVLFLAVIPYLATRRSKQWWVRTVLTLAAAWILMVAMSMPAMLLGSWLGGSKGDTYFVVGHWVGTWLYLGGAGVAVLALLSTVVGGLARVVFRSPSSLTR
jgi:hypothetical protein